MRPPDGRCRRSTRCRRADSRGTRGCAPREPTDPLPGGRSDKVPADEHEPALSPAQPRQRPRDRRRGGARRGLSRPRHGRAARGHRHGAAVGAVQLAPPVVRREPQVLLVVRSARTEGFERLPHLRPAHGTAWNAGGRSLSARAVVVALALLLAAGTLGACGGGSSPSDAVPKSTPDITAPNDTSAEQAAAQTTSTSTTKTKTSTSESQANESGGNEATEEPESGGSSSGAGEETATPSGGASAEKEESASEKSAAGSSPTGGAGAPTGK